MTRTFLAALFLTLFHQTAWAGLHTGGAWFISDETESPDLVTKAYFFHEEAGLSCVIIPSDKFGTE